MRVRPKARLAVQELEPRETPAATAVLAAGTLTITADALGGRLEVFQDGADIVARSRGAEFFRAPVGAVSSLVINGSGASDIVRVDRALTPLTTLNGNNARDKLAAGGGPATLNGGSGQDLIVGGRANNTFQISPDGDLLLKAQPADAVNLGPGARVLREAAIPPPPGSLGLPQETLTAAEVDILLQRAAAASSTEDAIIAIVDRNGRILGVRVEANVAPAITGNPATLVFAIDGAVAKARTGAFFGNNEAPLTSRTIQYISQSTITEREVRSNPNITDPDSTMRGPGFVAPIGIRGHFPPNIPFTPQVDLFAIEHTNRDGTFHVGPDRVKGTADDVLLPARFNINPAFVPPGNKLFPPDSYGFESGVLRGAQNRGIATLPGGIPIVKNGQVVGGMGVFFPGTTGFASEENSVLNSNYDPTRPDRSLEAEWIAFAALGGAAGFVGDNFFDFRVGELNGVALPAGFGLPLGRIDLVGIQLELFGPGGLHDGPRALLNVGRALGQGNPASGTNQVVDNNNTASPADDLFLRDGLPVPEGWLVLPHDGVGVTAAEVERIVAQGIVQAQATRAAIRLPLGNRSKMVFAVCDLEGNVVGLYRMPDATVFSIDVAVAKARNVAYYANAAKLQSSDQLPGVRSGSAFTNRTFRYLANPRFPTGIDFAPPAPFSQLADAPVNPFTGLLTGAAPPASAYQSVLGYNAFNPGTNFRDPSNILNQNGVIFFPGSAPIYRGENLIGGLGVSGDGVDQDDVITDAAQVGFGVPPSVLRADQIVYQGLRLPYQKFNRNPLG